MKKTIAFILILILLTGAVGITAHAKNDTKIGVELSKVINTVAPDEMIVVSLSLAESENCKKAHSWQADLNSEQSADLFAAIESDMDDILKSIPDDVSYTVVKKDLEVFQVQIKVKAKDVFALEKMQEVTRIAFVCDADGNYYDPAKYDPHFDAKDSGHFIKKDFLAWAEREGKDYDLKSISGKAENWYEELRFHGGTASERDYDWALIAVVLHPESIKDQEEIRYTDYTFFVYDNAADEFYPVNEIDISKFDGLYDELAERAIPELTEIINHSDPGQVVTVAVERIVTAPLTIEDMPAYVGGDKESFITARRQLAEVNRGLNEDFIRELSEYADFEVKYNTITSIVLLTLKAKDVDALSKCDRVMCIDYISETQYRCTAGTEKMLGDTDGDAIVTILDATGIQRELADLGVAVFDEECADCDEDGDVTILDATRIQRSLAELG